MQIRVNEKSNKLQLINKINLDDYIYSVLRFESLSYWPLEMQKVQAVASRTYAVYQMSQIRNKNSTTHHYDIKNSNLHQVYNGSHNCTHLRQAVYDTHNLILTYKDEVALTMFDICCGGVTPDHMSSKDQNKPYLYRKYKCTHCKKKSSYTWKESFSLEHLSQKLKSNPKTSKNIKRLGRLLNVSVGKKDKAGIVRSIILTGSKRKITITSQELKTILQNKLKSLAFTIKKSKNNILISGNGFGHNTGLCQFGSRELVARGWNFKKILRFYYPGTQLVQIKL